MKIRPRLTLRNVGLLILEKKFVDHFISWVISDVNTLCFPFFPPHVGKMEILRFAMSARLKKKKKAFQYNKHVFLRAFVKRVISILT